MRKGAGAIRQLIADIHAITIRDMPALAQIDLKLGMVKSVRKGVRLGDPHRINAVRLFVDTMPRLDALIDKLEGKPPPGPGLDL
jgi:hypothetical protein